MYGLVNSQGYKTGENTMWIQYEYTDRQVDVVGMCVAGFELALA